MTFLYRIMEKETNYTQTHDNLNGKINLKKITLERLYHFL